MNELIYIFANMTKPDSASVLEKAERVVASAGFDHRSFSEATALFEACRISPPRCVVTIGGDGTTLRAVSSAANNGLPMDIPIFGINLGKIGFFSETDIDGFEAAFARFLSGDFTVEQATMLEATVENGQKIICLNDFMIAKNGFSSICHVEVAVDGFSMGMIHGDGVIISTSTGSTGYSISAGGPVVAPNLEVMLITPICPHSLTVRPVVASFDSTIRVVANSECTLHSDGMQLAVLPEGASITIKKSDLTVKFIRVSERNVFRLIREKLV